MSGGIAQLVAIGAQDAHLVGQPEVSFFRSNYKRHTNFAQTVERQVIQGNPSANGMSTVRFERKGDMLGYVYVANRAGNITDWSDRISKVEILIGGQVIDEQDYTFSELHGVVPLHPMRKFMPNSFTSIQMKERPCLPHHKICSLLKFKKSFLRIPKYKNYHLITQ